MTVQSVERLEELVSKMELHEKLSMLAGKNLWETVPIERLQIPSLKVRIEFNHIFFIFNITDSKPPCIGKRWT